MPISRGWFSKQRACRKCGTPWRRGDVGFELGAATINTIITFGVIIVAGAVAMIATSPDIPTVKIVVGLVVAAVVIPVLIYPVTYTLWQALDLAMRPPTAGRAPVAARAVRPARRFCAKGLYERLFEDYSGVIRRREPAANLPAGALSHPLRTVGKHRLGLTPPHHSKLRKADR